MHSCTLRWRGGGEVARSRRRAWWPAWVWLLLAGVGPARGDFAYTVTSLGILPGGSTSGALGIAGAGRVTGEADGTDGFKHAFYIDSPGSTMTDVGTLGGPTSRGQAINAAGQIAGQSKMVVGGGSV